MNEIRYETDIIGKNYATVPTIFLAGPTIRGHQAHLQPSWRYEAVEILKSIGFNGDVIIPEFSDVTKPDLGNESWIVPWEYSGLKLAHSILFWIPRTKELIGLNTNFEFGFWLGKHKEKITYGRPDGSYRNLYLDIMWREIQFRSIRNTLQSTCEEAAQRAGVLFQYQQLL